MKPCFRALSLGVPLVLAGSSASACPFCNPKIKAAIYDSQFYPNLLTMLSAFFVLAAIVIVLSWLNGKRYKKLAITNSSTHQPTPVPLTTAATVLGIGIGGFIDGIVLHQILQWHEMLSNKIPATDYVGKSVNMFWDGIFHFFMLMVTFAGIILLWRVLSKKEVNRSGYLLSGGLLTGWGLFNLIEGVIDHQVLKLHNVRELTAHPQTYNLVFLGVSVVILITGWLLIKKGSGAGMSTTATE